MLASQPLCLSVLFCKLGPQAARLLIGAPSVHEEVTEMRAQAAENTPTPHPEWWAWQGLRPARPACVGPLAADSQSHRRKLGLTTPVASTHASICLRGVGAMPT